MGCFPDVFVGPKEFIFLNSCIIFKLGFFLLEKNMFFAEELRWEKSKFKSIFNYKFKLFLIFNYFYYV